MQPAKQLLRRLDFLTPVLISLLAVLAAFAVAAVFLIILGVDPINVYVQLVKGAVGTTYSLTQTLGKATPLLLVAIGICISFRASVLNIGAEGQVIVGGLATAAFALRFPDLPSWAIITFALLAGFVAGALYASIPGVLKAWFGVNEILSTIMMNQIAVQILILLLTGPMKDTNANATTANVIQSAAIPKTAWLPTLIKSSYFHTGLILAVVLAFVVFFFLWWTVAGYRIRAVGANQAAARYAGISVKQVTVMAMALSGGFAGLAGAVEVLGVSHRALQDFTSGYGFSGIVVALFGGLHPLGAIPAAFLFGGLLASGSTLQSAGVSSAMVTVLQGLVVMFVVGSSRWAQRTRRAAPAPARVNEKPDSLEAPVLQQESLP